MLPPQVPQQRPLLKQSDPLFADQWHLVNDEYPEHTLNGTSVWDMGITGKGVITSSLDDGFAFDVPDLKDAFVSPS